MGMCLLQGWLYVEVCMPWVAKCIESPQSSLPLTAIVNDVDK